MLVFRHVQKHPDVFLSRTDESEDEICKTQLAILSNVARYVKKGGAMVYSTCTLFKKKTAKWCKSFLQASKARIFALKNMRSKRR